MYSPNSTNNYPDPCSTILSNINGNTNNYYSQRPASCYRPLQQLYKTVYSPTYGNNPSQMNFACICRPAERYKTTNMTYGSFYYDDSLSAQKNEVADSQRNRALDYDRSIFARCYGNNTKMGSQSKGINGPKPTSILFDQNNPKENQYWTQPTSDACCPTDCCNNTTYYTANCTNYSNNDPCSTPYSQKSFPSSIKPDNTYRLY